MIYHVATNGNDHSRGDELNPLRTINRAASVALPGDVVKIHAGIYREWVSPENSGKEDARIVYEAAGDGEVVITGAEIFNEWVKVGNGVWKAVISNGIFLGRNPFATLLYGDWLFEELKGNHLGDVYLNGKSLYERQSMEDVTNPTVWENAKYKEDSLYTWYCKAEEFETTIWANFGKYNPNKELVEISVRPCCFFPEETGKNYITVRGLTLKQAATQWAPPTALQEGLIGPHWSKGWIIENNIISDSKCVGISLGKERYTGNNEWSIYKYKFGTQREQEVIFRALHEANWDKEHIGSHIVRNNIIHDCEQAGIVGHLGGAFSKIYGNHIYNIHHKRLFHGAEVSGIKLHASLDTQIYDNTIHSCYRAVWFDWQAQGTHLYNNICFDNLSEDLFIEVCHGPFMIDNNLFLSKVSYRNVSQGGAYVHNLFAGRIIINPDRNRQTPYHFPHETAVLGYANIIGGDERYINNIFLRDDDESDEPIPIGFFEHLPLKPRTKEDEEAEKKAQMEGLPSKNDAMLFPVGLGAYNEYPDLDDKFWEKPFGPAFFNAHLPSMIFDNLYLNNAKPCTWETGAIVLKDKGIVINTDASTGNVELEIDTKIFDNINSKLVTTETLGKTYHAEMNFEQPDKKPYIFNLDFSRIKRDEEHIQPGPFSIKASSSGKFTIKISR